MEINLVAGISRGVARVMNGFMNQIHIESGRTLDQREHKSLVERHNVEREKSEQQETRKDPFVTESSNRRFHNRLR
jgi:hypothetical protein